MTQITSRRADFGLPEERHGTTFSDDTYFTDGTTWTDASGSIGAGEVVPHFSKDQLRSIFNE